MFEIDLRTLYFSFILLLLVCLGVVIMLWYQARKRFDGMHLLVFYVFAQCAGVTLIAMRGFIPDVISIIVANMFVVGGAISGYVGLEKFVGLKTTRWRHYLLFLVFLCLQVVFTYLHRDQDVRNLNVGISLMLISLDNAVLLLYRVGKPMRKVTRILGIVFSFLVLVGVLRIFRYFLLESPGNEYFNSGLFESYVALMYQVSFFLLIFFLSLVVNKRLINEIKLQEDKFSRAFRYSPYAIIISRLDNGEILEVNKGFEGTLGYKTDDVIGRTTLDINIWLDSDTRDKYVAALTNNKRVLNHVYSFRKANGELMTGELSGEVFEIEDQMCVLTVLNDITQQKNTEAELRKSQKILRSFASHLQNAGEEEKIVLATQIDNELNQSLAALKMDIGLLKQKFKKNDETGQSDELIHKLDEVYKTLGNSLAFSLKLMTNLRNEVLYMMGLPDAIRLYVDEVNHKYPAIQCFFDLGKVDKLPQQKQSTILYRIFEDAISNALVHSQASEIIVSLHGRNNSLELEISDNGLGFEYSEFMEHSSHGLMLMRERTSLLDGEMFITSAPDEGTTVKIVIPLV